MEPEEIRALARDSTLRKLVDGLVGRGKPVDDMQVLQELAKRHHHLITNQDKLNHYDISEKVKFYSYKIGVSYKDFCKNVVSFFNASMVHEDRMRIFALIGKFGGIPSDTKEGKNEIWRMIGRLANISQHSIAQWKLGKADPEVSLLLNCLKYIKIHSNLHEDINIQFEEPVISIRRSIARTLTYINILPPIQGLGAGLNGSNQLKTCWKFVHEHPCYRELRRNDSRLPIGILSQKFLDEIEIKFSDYEDVVMPMSKIRILNIVMGDVVPQWKNDSQWREWALVWTLFKFATMHDQGQISSRSGELAWLWSVNSIQYNKIWKI